MGGLEVALKDGREKGTLIDALRFDFARAQILFF